jgi:hypothetical protein
MLALVSQAAQAVPDCSDNADSDAPFGRRRRKKRDIGSATRQLKQVLTEVGWEPARCALRRAARREVEARFSTPDAS